MKFYKLILLLEKTEKINIPHEGKLNNPREGLLKIYQMNAKKFVEFIKKIAPYIKDGKIDTSKIKITEKIDGTSFKLAWYNNKIWGESSYSGMKDSPSGFAGPFAEPFRETLKYFQKKLQKNFEKLFKNESFKLIGELLYTKNTEIDPDGTVTFVATKYDPKKLGKLATYVIFDVLKYDKDSGKFIPMDSKNKWRILLALKRWDDKNIKFLTPKDINWNGHVDLKYLIPFTKLNEILKTPEILLSDKNLFETVKNAFIQAFESAINKGGSALGTEASTIEGIVMDLGDTKIAFQNPEWKKLKAQLWEIPKLIEEETKNFYYNLIGKKTIKAMRDFIRAGNFSEEFLNKFEKEVPIFKRKLNQIAIKFDAIRKNLPKGLEKSHEKGIKNTLLQASKIVYNDPISLKPFLRLEEELEQDFEKNKGDVK